MSAAAPLGTATEALEASVEGLERTGEKVGQLRGGATSTKEFARRLKEKTRAGGGFW
jgi:hypothetical protein